MQENDILKEIENSFNFESNLEDSNIVFIYEVIVSEKQKRSKFISSTIFFIKYITTSSLIFLVLLLCTNYSAYYNILRSRIMKGQVEETKQGLINSVEAANITNNTKEEDINQDKIDEKLSIKRYKKDLDSDNINLDIDITTIDNRIIIPKMGKNIPLIDIKNRSISGQNELNEIFMEELENGVIRYPGSAKPGDDGLSFIFGHSSNFPWLKGEYNDVFATLDRVMMGDEVIVYYNQKKYTFKIRERAIIKPGDVGILKRNKNKAEIAIMTCWPIGTTLNRFVIVGELVN